MDVPLHEVAVAKTIPKTLAPGSYPYATEVDGPAALEQRLHKVAVAHGHAPTRKQHVRPARHRLVELECEIPRRVLSDAEVDDVAPEALRGPGEPILLNTVARIPVKTRFRVLLPSRKEHGAVGVADLAGPKLEGGRVEDLVAGGEDGNGGARVRPHFRGANRGQ